MRATATRKRKKESRGAPQASAGQPVVPAGNQVWMPHAWRIAVLWIVVFAAYSNSFEAGLVFDNDLAILQDARVHTATSQNIDRILTEGYWVSRPNSGLYRPLTTLSYLLNYAVLGDGPNPAGYHWVNLALHGVNVSLVYALGVLVLGGPALAFPMAAIWAVHPLLTESVTNIVGRADLLAAFGVLAGLLCHAKGSVSRRWRKFGWVTALVASQAVGLFSKESAAVLPGIMLLYDLTWSERATWRARVYSYAALALPFATFFYLRSAVHAHMQVLLRDNLLVSAGFWTARLTAVKVMGKYLWLFAWPARLSADYSYNAVPIFGWHLTEWKDAETLLALAVFLGAIWLAVRWRREWKPMSFFIVFFFVTLSPVSNLIILIGSVMAERFVYLPSIGLAGCTVVAIHMLSSRFLQARSTARQTAWIALGFVCLAFGARTYARNFDWYDAYSLWTSAVRANPDGARAHLNLGNALAQIPDRLPEAIAEYEAALRIDPNYAEAHNNLGDALMQESGRLQDAIGEYENALKIDPRYAHAHNNLGSALSRIPGRSQDTIAEYQAALRIDPNYAQAHSNLGNAVAKMPGRLPEALAEFEDALRVEPDSTEAHYGLGTVLARMPGRLPEAAAEFAIVLRSKPGDAEAHNNLGNVYASMPGRIMDAIAEWNAALRINPALVQTHYNLGIALSQMPGRMPEAISQLEVVSRITGDPRIQQIINRLRATRN
jgi:protein O-mannosyl-transferase